MAIYRGTGGSTSTTEQATIDAVNEDAATATTKAAEASASATAAATSASSASSSATSAASSASTATTKATEASTSATNAATSASAASTSASAASTSASNAASSATTATTQAASATTSAANAAASETAAETAESNAEDFASDAQKSAYGAVDTLQTLSDSSTLYSARHYASKTAADAATATTKAAEAATSASTASAASDAALAALDSFDDRYLGSKTSDPTLDNDGDALVAGALYYNTTDDVMKVYEGSTWVAAYASVSGALLQSANLSDLPNAATARTNLGVAIGTDVQAYSSVLAGTTASYTTAEETKLASIETGADVTDTVNVTAAGALMDSEITNLAQVKAFNSADYATAAQGVLADSALQSSDIGTSVQAYSAVLAGTTASYTTAEETKLAGIESAATADQTAQEIATAIDADATAEATLKSALGLGTAAYTASTDYVATSGDTMTGALNFGDSVKAQFGAGSDLQIYHNGSYSFIQDVGTGSLVIAGTDISFQNGDATEIYADFVENGAVSFRYDNATKLATSPTGVSVTGRAVGTLTTDNDLSFDMNASNQFKCTPTANGTLTFTNITAGQSGNIFLVNSGGYAISAAATTYISAADLSAISTAGSYFLSYFSDGTNVMVSASAAVTSAGA